MLSHGHQILAGNICIILETFPSHLLVLLPYIALHSQPMNMQLCTAKVVIDSSTIFLCSQRNVICYLIV